MKILARVDFAASDHYEELGEMRHYHYWEERNGSIALGSNEEGGTPAKVKKEDGTTGSRGCGRYLRKADGFVE